MKKRKRAVLPEYEVLMARPAGNDVLDDLNAVRGYFPVEKGDPMVALANSAPSNFSPSSKKGTSSEDRV